MGTINQKYLVCSSIDNLKGADIHNSCFLGKWCLPFPEANENKKYTILDFAWNNRRNYEKAYFYCLEIFEELLVYLTTELNRRLNVDNSIQYYRIILSPWLIHYIFQAYDKYISIQKAYEKNEFTTYILHKDHFYIPIDYSDFIAHIITNDTYNLQQYSRIVQYLGLSYSYIDVKNKNIQRTSYREAGYKLSIVDKAFSVVSSLLHSDDKLMTLTQPYFLYNKLNKYKLVFKSKFQIVLNEFKKPLQVNCTIDHQKRQSNKNIDKNFKNYLQETILEDIPLIYFENLQKFQNNIDNLNIIKTPIFYTANAHYSNEIYKFYIAKNYDSIISITSQHGGVNGTHYLSLEEIDDKLSKYFFTFGWGSANHNEIPMYNFNISLIKNTFRHMPKEKEILFISTGQPRNIFRFHSSYSATEYEILLDQSIDFLKSIQDANVIFRGYQNDFGWNSNQYIETKTEKKLYHDTNKSIVDSYKTADIVVSNHIGSTYLESISLNIPTIVFCDEDVTLFRDSAQEIYNLLKEVGIFHTDGISAAKFINNLYSNNRLETWWNSQEVIEVKEFFKKKYSHTTDNWNETFIKRLERLRDKNE